MGKNLFPIGIAGAMVLGELFSSCNEDYAPKVVTIPEYGVDLGGHKGVNLGLPKTAENKTIYWATFNLGANSADDYGDSYAWGAITTWYNQPVNWVTYSVPGTQPTISSWKGDSSYTMEYAPYYDKGLRKYTKYTTNGTLSMEDDAIHVLWGGNWRMPTIEEFVDLKTNCYWEWTYDYLQDGRGISGFIVYKAKDESDKGVARHYDGIYWKSQENRSERELSNNPLKGSYNITNSPHIFLRAEGCFEKRTFHIGDEECVFGDYWTSSINAHSHDEPKDGYAYTCMMANDAVKFDIWFPRYLGMAIRGICVQ